MTALNAKTRILFPVLLSSALLLLLYLFLSRYYLSYSPFSDDPATALGWNRGVIRWFTVGFGDLLIPYPEWYVAGEDFMRPGSSLLWRIKQLWFGSNYALSFALQYVIQFFAVLIAVLTGRRMGLTMKWLSALALLVAFNPGFANWTGLMFLSGANDIPIGLTSILAFYLLCMDQYWLALIPLTIGVSVKENALIFPVAACLSTFVTTRKKLLSLLLLTPDVAWYLLRKMVFTGQIGANYAVPTKPADLLALALKGILFWPTGIIADDSLRTMIGAHSIKGREVDALFVVLNLLMWGALAYIGWQVIKGASGSPPTVTTGQQWLLPLLIWTFGALGFGLFGPKVIYGAPIYMLELLLFILLFNYGSFGRLRATAGFAIAVLAVSFVWQLQAWLRNIEWEPFQSMNSLVAGLRENNTPDATVYVINSPQSYASPKFVESYAGVKTHFVPLNEFTGCARALSGSTTVMIEDSRVLVTSHLPGCAKIGFSQVHPRTLAPAVGGTLQRGTFAAYSFPAGRITSMAVRTGEPNIDYANRIDVTLTPENRKTFMVLYYDWQLGRYRCAGPGCRA